MNSIRLSPASLNIFLDCPKCFWLEKNKSIKRPRGVFPSLPGGMDPVIKTYFDFGRLGSLQSGPESLIAYFFLYILEPASISWKAISVFSSMIFSTFPRTMYP